MAHSVTRKTRIATPRCPVTKWTLNTVAPNTRTASARSIVCIAPPTDKPTRNADSGAGRIIAMGVRCFDVPETAKERTPTNQIRRQSRLMRRVIKRQKTIVGRLQREIERKASAIGQAVREALDETLSKAQRIAAQSAQRKAMDGPKLYAWHAPEVECISKGKARQPYEFGVKVGIASTFKGNLIVGARSFAGNPYDGHTLREQLEQSAILMQDCQIKLATAFVDLGYRGVEADNPDVGIVHRGKARQLSQAERKQLKRRQAIEPIIGHLKSDHGMDRCHLKGRAGDAMHAVLCAAGYNIRWLLRMIAK